jgi:hypothetical protein
MTPTEFTKSTLFDTPPSSLSVPLTALWYDANGDWTRAHDLVDELETKDGMAVHAYLHRKHGDLSNSEYWYERAGDFRRDNLEEERTFLIAQLLK